MRENSETECPTRHFNPTIHKSSLNPSAAPLLTSNSRNDNVVGDLTIFFLKKDLSLSRFKKFTDRPKVFATWKTSFQSITREL